MSETVLTEKQQLLGLPQHSFILDVKTRCNSLYLMIERFMEQFPAIQAAALDSRLQKALYKDNLDRLKDDHENPLYIHEIAIGKSCEKNAACGQILPILQKLEEHFTLKDEDTMFVASMRSKKWMSQVHLQLPMVSKAQKHPLKDAAILTSRF
ncbi:uncharacterized protein LOC113656671 [Tachysurus fulvidraco]|uniref:uncharacterized protein LOC113656671 n=1 Tax=Tachysurus fulvidraco TaxID=1234273 RepID=UPI001FEE1534|nr:uncharacterized protein LOC113656671 [Tachysurus fulvidraco]